MRRLLKTIGLCAILFGVAIWLSGCHTLRGIGKDTAAAGHAISGVFKRAL